MTTFQHLPSIAKLLIILSSSLFVLAVSVALAQWPPEVLLHRQGDRPGFNYERIEGLGDWTGDGIADFAVLSYSSGFDSSVLDIWWGGETLSSNPDTTICLPDSLVGGAIKSVGDVTADGISDWIVGAVVPGTWRTYLCVYRGGRQVELLQILRVDFTDMVSPGDISGDRIPDLVLGSYNDSKIMVYLGTPTGFEGPVDTLEGVGYHLGGGLVSGADMDGDGWGDFACYFSTRDTTFALFHPQPGSYLDDYEIYEGNFASLIPQAYHSGRPALVLAHRNVFSSRNILYVHLGGNGSDTIPDAEFSLPELFAMSVPVYAGDVNHDGWGDWVAGSDGNFGGLGAFLLFLGGPWISNYSYWMVGAQGQDYWAMGKGMAGVGDVNGDGVDDFAMLCSNDTTGHGGSQLVVFAGDEEWHAAADDRRPAPVRLPVTIQAYPNPFNASTWIVIEGLRAGSPFDLSIHNILGQEVFHSQERAVTDRHTSAWQPDQSLSGGIYFFSVNTGISKQTRKLLLIR